VSTARTTTRNTAVIQFGGKWRVLKQINSCYRYKYFTVTVQQCSLHQEATLTLRHHGDHVGLY